MTKTSKVFFGLLAVLAVPTAAAAQASTTSFVGGLGGITFGTATSGAFAARAGVPITPDLSVVFEAGRMMNVLPGEVADGLDVLEELLELEFGTPVDIEISAPATYGFAGMRYARSGARFTPFLEAGAGVGRITIQVDKISAFGLDLDDLTDEEIGDEGNFTEFLFAIGGGVNVPVADRMSVDVGYRFTRIFMEEPTVNTSMIYAAIQFGF